MSAADELERVADEFQGRFDTCVAHARGVGDRAAEYGAFMAKADAFLEIRNNLRERAAELRKRCGEPSHAPLAGLPKPSRSRVRQWWSYDGIPPKRIEQTSALAAKTTQTHAIFELRSDEADMLTNDRWTCHGSGPEPAR